MSLGGIEGKLLSYLLERHNGNVRETARRTGISKDKLYRHLAKEGKRAPFRVRRVEKTNE
jgi:DNA-binding NtrC family response regulator